jgi:signal recognition particle subunit SRP54
VGLTRAVLTKVEGDAPGGAGLSFRAVLGVPVKYLGVGERLQDLTEFDAPRMAGRILQMGDVVGLVERAEQAVDEDATRQLEESIKEGRFDLEDFLAALQQLQNMGPLENLLKMLPGVKQGMLDQVETDPRRIRHMEAIVLSMTPEERRRPGILNGSRRARIAQGAGRPVSEVNRLIKQFEQMKKMMKRMKRMKGSKKMKALMGRGGGMGPFG